MPTELPLDAREMALWVRETARQTLDGLVHHSDAARDLSVRYCQTVADAGVEASTDELIGALIDMVRPARPNGRGAAWELLLGRPQEITDRVDQGLSIVKIHDLLTRSGTVVPYRTLRRFASTECGFTGRGGRRSTVRVLDGEPGVECQVNVVELGR